MYIQKKKKNIRQTQETSSGDFSFLLLTDVRSRCPPSFSELISDPFGGSEEVVAGVGAPREVGRCPPRADGDLLTQPPDPRCLPRSCSADPPKRVTDCGRLRVNPFSPRERGRTCARRACQSAFLPPTHAAAAMHRKQQAEEARCRSAGGGRGSDSFLPRQGSAM